MLYTVHSKQLGSISAYRGSPEWGVTTSTSPWVCPQTARLSAECGVTARLSFMWTFKQRKVKNKKQIHIRRQQKIKDDITRAARYKMREYDSAVELTPTSQINLIKDNLAPHVVLYDLETAGFKREHDILQVPTHISLPYTSRW